MTDIDGKPKGLDFRECITAIQQEPSVERRMQLCEQYLDDGSLGDKESGVLYGCIGACYFERAHDRAKALAGSKPSPSEISAFEHDLRSSVQYYTTAIGINPEHFLNYWNRGLCFEYLGDRDQALNDYTQTIATKADFAEGYIYRARILEQMGELDKAAADLAMAQQLGGAAGT